MELFFTIVFEGIFLIIRWILFIAASVIMFPCWFLTIVIHPYWIKIFDPKKDAKYLSGFNLVAFVTFLRALIWVITGIIMVPAWLIAFNLNDYWFGIIGD